MLERLFDDYYIRQRLLESPMGPYLEVLVSKLFEAGYCHSQAQRIVNTAVALGRWLEARGLTPVEAGKHDLWTFMAMHRRAPSGRLADGAVGCTRLPGLLQSLGLLTKKPASPADPALSRFDDYLTNVRGVTQTTIASYRRYLHSFVLGLCEDGAPNWSKLTPEYVIDFVFTEAAQARSAKKRIVTAVRSFLRFSASDGTAPPQLVFAVPRVQTWRYADLPRHLSAEELQTVLKACQSEQYGSLRNRAFIALLARVGVRSGELRHLRLDDVDWAEGRLNIKQSKSGCGRSLPIPSDAGKLLTNYIRLERPQTDYREIFLTSATPRRPFGECAASSFVKLFLKKLGLDGPGRGPHSFRHTAATLMVQNGVPLKDVADVLGHRSLQTTTVYVKLDEPSLRDVALPWKGGKS